LRHLVLISLASLILAACGGDPTAASPTAAPEAEATSGSDPASSPGTAADSSPGTAADGQEGGSGKEFEIRESDTARHAHGATPSKIEPTATEAALKFFVVDKDKGPIKGIVIKLTAPDGTTYHTEATDAAGYAEVLVPVGQKYDLVYLSLGRRDVAAKVAVDDHPKQTLKLTLRYKRHGGLGRAGEPPRFILQGVTFETGKATIQPDSYPQLDNVVDYMKHDKSARIEVSGHTDNVGNPKSNKKLSQRRAQACRDYLISKGIDGGRIQAVGYGEERPVASNDTEEGRAQNRRIEAKEL
jgi:outer membrane protein OmpA-like peptidoglycan-associated protein